MLNNNGFNARRRVSRKTVKDSIIVLRLELKRRKITYPKIELRNGFGVSDLAWLLLVALDFV